MKKKKIYSENIRKMFYDEKSTRNGLSDSEAFKREEKMLNSMEPFPFSALHFLRNRLMPTGTWQLFP